MRHEIVSRLFALLSVVIVGACLLFAWAVKG
jgi:hypothetical protein